MLQSNIIGENKCTKSAPKINFGWQLAPNGLYSNQNCLVENQLEMRFIENHSALQQHYKGQIQILVRSSITIQPTQTQGIPKL